MSDYFADDTLNNKLGITDPTVLHNTEEHIVALKTASLLDSEAPFVPDLSFLRHIHNVLFEDLYDFAGNFRTVDITKPDSAIPFAYARFLNGEAARIFNDLAQKNYLADLPSNAFTQAVASLAAELNALHPFRDGNGRTIRLFLILLASRAGYIIDYSRVGASEIIQADKAAFEGNDKILVDLYRKIII